MIKTYIKEIKSKPEPHRKRFTYGVSAIITILIGLVWFTSFGYFNSLNSTGHAIADNSTDNSNVVATTDSSNKNANTGPFSVLGNNISNAYDAFRSAIGIKVPDKKSDKNNVPTLQYVPEE